MDENEKTRCHLHHRSLFARCETFICFQGSPNTVDQIRIVVQRHSEFCPQRKIAYTSDIVRGKVLSLTSNQNFEGNALKALSSLIELYSNVNSSLCDIFGVTWIRMKDTRPNLWRHPLLAMYILKNLLLHGPVTTIAEAYDGIELPFLYIHALLNPDKHDSTLTGVGSRRRFNGEYDIPSDTSHTIATEASSFDEEELFNDNDRASPPIREENHENWDDEMPIEQKPYLLRRRNYSEIEIIENINDAWDKDEKEKTELLNLAKQFNSSIRTLDVRGGKRWNDGES